MIDVLLINIINHSGKLGENQKGQGQPVSGADAYPTDKGSACTVNFDPVKTKGLRLEVTLPTDNAAGLFEWNVR